MKRVLLVGLATVGVLMTGCDPGTPEGTWACSSEWSGEQEGETVLTSVEQRCTCADNVMKVTGVVSIGDAQWSEKKEGTCHASGDELYGKWTSIETTSKNEAARIFERERLEGKSLASTSTLDQEHRVRVTSRTDTSLTAVNAQGRVLFCNRL